jgi:hypothetical protein
LLPKRQGLRQEGRTDYQAEIAEKIEADEKSTAFKIMSALSCTSVRGVPQKSTVLTRLPALVADTTQSALSPPSLSVSLVPS